MKLTKFAVMALAIMISTLTSCSDKGYWDEYVPEGPEYSFEQATPKFTTKETNPTVTVNVIRSTTKGAATVEITATKVSEGVTVPTSVTFEDGKNCAPLDIKLTNGIPGPAYTATLSFGKDVAMSPSAEKTCVCTINIDYNWISLGNGQFADLFMLGEKYFDVEIRQAEGFKRYRVIKPYHEGMAADTGEWEDWRTGEYPEYIEFWDNGDGVIQFNSWNCGIIYEANPGDYIVAYPGSRFNGGSIANNVWAEPGYACFSPYYYIDGLGGFNNSTKFGVVQVILPK